MVMPQGTKNRLNITLRKEVQDALSKIAKRDNVPQATKAASLLEMALELEEDHVWDALAAKREKTGTKYVSHDDAWA